MKSIIKRDGKEMPFDESKIFNAIYAANKAVVSPRSSTPSMQPTRQ